MAKGQAIPRLSSARIVVGKLHHSILVVLAILSVPLVARSQDQREIKIPIKGLLEIPEVIRRTDSERADDLRKGYSALQDRQTEIIASVRKANLISDMSERETRLKEIQAVAEALRIETIDFNVKVIAAETEALGSELSERASTLIRCFEDVTAEMGRKKIEVDGDKVCSEFFRKMFCALRDKGFSDTTAFWEGKNADAIFRELQNNLSQPGGDWLAVPEDSAQRFANCGFAVVGATPKDDSGHGHVAFVFPVTTTIEQNHHDGVGPFLRDGNEGRAILSDPTERYETA